MIASEYINIYKEYREALEKNSPNALNRLRGAGMASLEKSDLNIFRDEYAIDYGLNIQRYTIEKDPYKLFTCEIPSMGAYVYYVINDTFYANPSQKQLPDGVVISSLAEASITHSALVEEYLGRLMKIDTNPNEALNAMLAQDGMFVYVPKGVRMDRPIQLVNLMYGRVDVMAVAHNLIILDEDSQAQVLVCDHSSGNVKYLANRVTEVFVNKNAVYDHYKVENTQQGMTNICSLLIDEKEGGEVVSNIITLHNSSTANKINATLSERRSSLSLCGMCFLDGAQYASNESEIVHFAPDTTSFESFKYILDDESKGNFYGMIKVMPDAQKSSSMQTNKNICLSDKARMKALPQLEIYADDVKCNHGATVGQLDDAAMFYMQSRGISEKEARTLLMSAFVHDVQEKIRIPELRDTIRHLVEKRLRKENSKCTTCGTCFHKV